MQDLPKFEIDSATEKRDNMAKLAYNIKTQVKIVEDETDALKDMFIRHQLSDQNKDGLLTVPQGDYLDCVKLERQKINKFLEQELQHWDLNLEQTKARVDAINDELMQMIAQQQSALEEYLVKFKKTEKSIKFSLK